MKKTIVSISIILALLLTTTTVFAKAERTAISGTEHMFFGAPGGVSTSGGWVQLRDVPLTGTFDFGALQGTETQLVNAKLARRPIRVSENTQKISAVDVRQFIGRR